MYIYIFKSTLFCLQTQDNIKSFHTTDTAERMEEAKEQHTLEPYTDMKKETEFLRFRSCQAYLPSQPGSLWL